MDRSPSSETLYLDSSVSREQRNQAEEETVVNTDQGDQKEEGVIAGLKNRIDSMASGSSMAELGNSVSAVAQDSAGAVKETVMESVPQALHTVQDQIYALASGAKAVEETVSETLSEETQKEFEHIDNMPNERVCDFLRNKHMSNAHVRPTD